MRRFAPFVPVALLALILAACSPAATAPAPAPDSPLAKALTRANAEKKIVILHFTGSDWCPPCQALDKNVLSTDRFARWASDKILLDLDFPNQKPQTDEVKTQNAAVRDAYKVENYPTVILLSPDGKEISRTAGYLETQSAEAYLADRDKEIASKK